jgi:hypothetical protein
MTGIRTGAFVGRDAELSVCREVISQVIHGRGRALLIDGEPGIGKSALLGMVLELARSCDCTVLQGRADDLTQQVPMRVMLDCLGGNPVTAIHEADPGEPHSELAAPPLDRVVAIVTSLCTQSPVVLAICTGPMIRACLPGAG